MNDTARPALGLLLALASCGRSAPAPVTVRLLDLYTPAAVSGGEASGAPALPRTEWRFDAPLATETKPLAPTRGWEVAQAIASLAVREGRLVGRSTGASPVLHVERKPDPEDRDLLHAVEVRLRVSAGSNLAIAFRPDEKLDLAKTLKRLQEPGRKWRMTSPILPGAGQLRTYSVRSPFPIRASEIRHMLLRPTDAAGATFEIESVRLVFRREYLAGVPSGPGWQGLSEVYRESLVSRAPETIRLKLRLPARPRLDLAVGTIEDEPVRFRVAVHPSYRAPDQESVLLEKTVTTPHRWENAFVDLARFAGGEVEIALSLESRRSGALGFWGAPSVRSLGAMPAPARRRKAPIEPPQGVILIWADTLRRDHLSAYGYGRLTSPVLDRLAAEGALFRDCVGQASWTKVATPSLMTSLYPLSHGVAEFTDRLPSSATTLAEAYRAAGYATLSFSSILFTGRFTNLHQGFEELHEDGSLSDRESSKTAREYVDRLLAWLETHRELPFFVFLHVSDPHDPYRPRPPYDTLWADTSRRETQERDLEHVRRFITDPLLRDFGMPTWAQLARARLDPRGYVALDRDLYDGSIRGMDVEIGRLVEGLRGLGLDGKTLLVFTGDHGEEFLEHGRMFHGQSTYGELTNVPLVFWGPGVSPAVIEPTVETIDVMPTLLEISRLPLPEGVQGRSLLPLLGGGLRPVGAAPGAAEAATQARGWVERPAFSEKAAIQDSGGPPPRETESYAIVEASWKLIHNVKRPAGDPEYELYDHRRDPTDQTDVSAEQPALVERLARELELWRWKAAAERLPADSASQEMSKEDLERLRSLGYIQ